jgi:hypothetical protein
VIVYTIIHTKRAIIRDKKDASLIDSPWLRDNDPADTYFYEMIFETGPMGDHGCNSNVYFNLYGDDDHTGVRDDSTIIRQHSKKNY